MRAADHRGWERAVEGLLDGELNGPRGEVVHRHVRDCPNCAGYAAVLLAVRAALRRRSRTLRPLSPRRQRRLAVLDDADLPGRDNR